MTKTYHAPINQQRIYGGKITLYQLSGLYSQNWHMRFKSPVEDGKYVRKSTKTEDFSEATGFAIEEYDRLRVRSHLGIKADGVTLPMLAEKFDPQMSGVAGTVKIKRNIMKKYLLPYFGKKDLYAIDEGDIWGYIQWRNDTFKPSKHAPDGIAASSVALSLGILKYYLTRAFNKRLILSVPKFPTEGQIAKPSFKNIKWTAPSQRRAAMTDEQDKQMGRWLGEFRKKWKAQLKADKGIDTGNKQLLPTHKRDRLTKVTFYVLATMVRVSGLRSVELRKAKLGSVITFNDGKTGEKFSLIEVTAQMSKVNKWREVVCSNMETMAEIWEDYKYEYKLYFGIEPADENWAFPTPHIKGKKNIEELARQADNPPLRNISTLFAQQMLNLDKECSCVMSEVKSRYDGEVRKISFYSLRKGYIMKMLQNEKMNVYVLARQCGSSIQMFERYYDVNLGRVHRHVFTEAVRHLRKLDEERASKKVITD